MNIYIGEPIEVSDMQGPCPDGFHVPLSSEWQALYNAFTGLGLSNSTHLLTYLKLPFAGYRDNTKSVSSAGSYGAYWSSSINGDGSNIFYFGSVLPQIRVFDRCYGLTIRPFKDTPKVPTDSWTKLYGTSIESGGIFHNPTDGLISISSDGSTWYTIMDKNLGATEVCEYSSPLSDANCGNVFQRGNNYPFPGTQSSDSITSLTTQVDASTYGPGNYYESSTYITRGGSPRGWDSSNNTNLWGGVSQGTSTKSAEVKKIYIGKCVPAGIYHSSDLGLISISSDGENWTTISDKNVGATAAGTTSANYGNYYSWGATEDRNGKSASSYTMQEDWSLGNQTIATSGFHIPTQAERTNIITMLSNLTGISSLNYNHAMQYFLLPRAGQMLDSSTSVSYAETNGGGYYWTSTKSSTTAAYLVRSTSSALNATGSGIKFPRGFSVRLFKDSGQMPTSDWTALAQLYKYNQLCALPENDGLTELNTKPQVYYNKYNTEGYIYFDPISLYYKINGTRFMTADGSIWYIDINA